MYCDQLPSSNLSSFLNFVKSHWNRSSFTEHMHLSANWHFPSSQFYVRNHEGFPPTTAKLLGGIGRQWQGISASHRWVGERIQPRGWPQMSANSQIWHFFWAAIRNIWTVDVCVAKLENSSTQNTWSMSFFLIRVCLGIDVWKKNNLRRMGSLKLS